MIRGVLKIFVRSTANIPGISYLAASTKLTSILLPRGSTYLDLQYDLTVKGQGQINLFFYAVCMACNTYSSYTDQWRVFKFAIMITHVV